MVEEMEGDDQKCKGMSEDGRDCERIKWKGLGRNGRSLAEERIEGARHK